MNDLAGIIAYNCIKETPPRDFKPSTESEKLYCSIMNEKSWECDVYMLFERFMMVQKKMF